MTPIPVLVSDSFALYLTFVGALLLVLVVLLVSLVLLVLLVLPVVVVQLVLLVVGARSIVVVGVRRRRAVGCQPGSGLPAGQLVASRPVGCQPVFVWLKPERGRTLSGQ